jgi:hypothetical protein
MTKDEAAASTGLFVEIEVLLERRLGVALAAARSGAGQISLCWMPWDLHAQYLGVAGE